MTDEIRDLMIRKSSTTELKQLARESGVVFLRESAIEKLLDGETTLKEINRVTFVE